jgi:tetratricopeptide (TPR) repeat protein
LEAAIALPGLGAEQQQDAYFAEGECLFNLEDFSGLISCLQKAHDAAPQSPKAADLEAMIQRFQPLADAQASVAKLTAAAAKAEGLDRAKLLDQLVDAETKLGQVRPNAKQAEEVAKQTKEIIALDPDNKAGLKTKYRLHELVGEAVAARRANDLKKAQAALDEALALPGLTDDQKANVEHIKKLLDRQ